MILIWLIQANEWVASNGSLCFRKDFWDRHGANIVTFSRFKKAIMERDHSFFADIFFRIGLGNVDTREA